MNINRDFFATTRYTDNKIENRSIMQNIGYVFINGAGLNASIWSDVVAKLDAPTLCVDYPERGSPKASVDLAFDDYINAALRQIEAFTPDKIVLVGHSIGGVVMMRLSELLASRVVGVAAISAAIPQPGGSFLSCLPQPKRFVIGTVMRLLGTNVPPSAIRKGICSDLSDAQAQKIIEQFTPESRALYTTPVTYTKRDMPALYVISTEDKELAPAVQRQMATRLGGKTVEIAGGHLSMVSHADEVASGLATFAADL